MKYFMLSILAVIITWSLIGLITQDMDFGGMGIFIGGITFGFILRKVSEPKYD